MKHISEPTEQDRLVAILNGNELASFSKSLWYAQEKIRREIESGLHTERDRLRAQLQAEIKKNLSNKSGIQHDHADPRTNT
jgi:hypothetical protein